MIRNFVAAPPAEVPAWAERGGALFLGRLAEDKGVRDVVELARVAPDVPVDVVGFGELAGELSAAAAEMPNLAFHGRVRARRDRAAPARARVALMPSLAPEGGPLVALQAMALGRPSSPTTRVGWVSTSRRGGGDVVEPGAEPLAVAVRRLLGDADGVDGDVSATGAAAVLAEHTPAAYVERLERVYASVC